MMERIDATTRAGFLEIAGAFGRERAWETRIAQLNEKLENDKGFRWFGLKWERLIKQAEFDRDWERDNPTQSVLMREAGISY